LFYRLPRPFLGGFLSRGLERKASRTTSSTPAVSYPRWSKEGKVLVIRLLGTVVFGVLPLEVNRSGEGTNNLLEARTTPFRVALPPGYCIVLAPRAGKSLRTIASRLCSVTGVIRVNPGATLRLGVEDHYYGGKKRLRMRGGEDGEDGEGGRV